MELKKPQYGLIRYIPPEPPAPHKCKPPSSWMRFFYRITCNPIRIGSLWRCECGQVFKLEYVPVMTADEIAVHNVITERWIPNYPIEYWTTLGGRE